MTYLCAKEFDPDQERVPAGSPEGGQWLGDDGDGIGEYDAPERDYGSLVHLASDINGFTKHGINQAIERGVSPSRILDAVNNPIRITPGRDNTMNYVGRSATVVLNAAGEVVTLYPKRSR